MLVRCELDPNDAERAACVWVERALEREDGSVRGEVVAEEGGRCEWVEVGDEYG